MQDSDSDNQSPRRGWTKEQRMEVSVEEWILLKTSINFLIDPKTLVYKLGFNTLREEKDIIKATLPQYKWTHWIYSFQEYLRILMTEDKIVEHFPNVKGGKNIRVRPSIEVTYDPTPCRDVRENVTTLRFDEGAKSTEKNVRFSETITEPREAPTSPQPSRGECSREMIRQQPPRESARDRERRQEHRSRRRSPEPRKKPVPRTYSRGQPHHDYRSSSRHGERQVDQRRDHHSSSRHERRRSERRGERQVDDYHDHTSRYCQNCSQTDLHHRERSRSSHSRRTQEDRLDDVVYSQVFYNSRRSGEDSFTPRGGQPLAIAPLTSTVSVPDLEASPLSIGVDSTNRTVHFRPAQDSETVPKSSWVICPVKTCGKRQARMKWHVYNHFPAFMRITDKAEDVSHDNSRREALQLLAGFILGTSASIKDLMDWVLRTWTLHGRPIIAPEMEEAMCRLHILLGYPEVRHFTLDPVNSPAVLIHWRIFAHLFNNLTEQQRSQLFQEPLSAVAVPCEKTQAGKDKPLVEPVCPSTVPEKEDLVAEPEVAPSSSTSQIIPLVPVFEENLDYQADPETMSVDSVTENELLGVSPTKDLPREPVMDQTVSSSPVIASPPEKSQTLDPKETQSEKEDSPTEKTWAMVVKRKMPIKKPVPQAPPPAPKQKQLGNLKGLEVAFDSHFHLNRIGWKTDMTLASPEEAIMLSTGMQPEYTVNVSGGVMVFCDPEEFSRIQLGDYKPNWRIAVGVHPKAVSRLEDSHMDHLQRLLADFRVAAVGEVGLDHTCPKTSWTAQEEFLEKVLSLGCLGRVLVLHVRGSRSDQFSQELYAKCLEIVKRHCSKYQCIHLHCFNGDTEVVKAWRDAFPNCYFGFTGMVKNFQMEQRKALRQVLHCRLLLETDSPYLQVHRDQDFNTPAFIGDVAYEVARILMMPPAEVLRITTQNGRSLYGFHIM